MTRVNMGYGSLPLAFILRNNLALSEIFRWKFIADLEISLQFSSTMTSVTYSFLLRSFVNVTNGRTSILTVVRYLETF